MSKCDMKGNQAYWDKGNRTCYMNEGDTAILARGTKDVCDLPTPFGFCIAHGKTPIRTLHCPGNIILDGKNKGKTCSTFDTRVAIDRFLQKRWPTSGTTNGNIWSDETGNARDYTIHCKESNVDVSYPLGENAGHVQFKCVKK